MSFIQPDERIVILDYNSRPANRLNAEELVRLRDVGIKTVMCYLEWHQVETAPGVYDWSIPDADVERITTAGLKCILKVYLCTPTFFDEDWYLHNAAGEAQHSIEISDDVGDVHGWSVLSPWNMWAWNYHLEFIEKACERYARPDVLCINISPANGEGLLPGIDLLFDDYAVASYRHFTGMDDLPGEAVPGSATLDWLRETLIPGQVETQRIFQKYGGEYWTQLHHAFETIPSTGNWLIDDLYSALHKELGDEHWGICYTVFRAGETRGLWGPEQDIKRHGVKMLFASEGPAGLLANTMKAIRMGARGMLTGPLAPYMRESRLQDWMYSAIRTTNGWWPA